MLTDMRQGISSEWEEVKARAGKRSEAVMCPEQGKLIHLKLETSPAFHCPQEACLKMSII
jgi:hypothetical protein